ncbi:MAG: hypothetical protein ACXQS1_01030 [Methermicoccaceae archaeon]
MSPSHTLPLLVLVLALACLPAASSAPLEISELHAGESWAEFTITASENVSDVRLYVSILSEEGTGGDGTGEEGTELLSMHTTIGKMTAGEGARKLFVWESLEEGVYLLKIGAECSRYGVEVGQHFSASSAALSEASSAALLGFRVSSASASSKDAVIVLAPTTETHPKLVVITFQLLSGSNGVFTPVEEHTITSVPVVQSQVVEYGWRTLLVEGEHYVARFKVSPYGESTFSSYLVPFTAEMDAAIADVYADEDGVSITTQGKSMVPLRALVQAVVSNASGTVLSVEKPAPYLTVDSDSVDFIWSGSLSEGQYDVVVRLLTSDGDELDSYEAVLEVKPRKRSAAGEPPSQTAGLGAGMAVLCVLLTALYARRR